MRGPGYDKLWGWFGLSRASFCVMPRVLMHEMPDEWQSKMADLLEEYQATFYTTQLPDCKVMAVDERRRFSSWPDWLLNYRRPDAARIEEYRRRGCDECGKLDHECECIDAMIASVQ